MRVAALLIAAAIAVPPAPTFAKQPRSTAAKNEFKRQQPCPSTGKSRGACPGYVVDHVVPLKRGGPDKPGNMQWQTREEAKAKDKWE